MKVSPHRYFYFEVRYTDAFKQAEATKLLQLDKDVFTALVDDNTPDQVYWEFSNFLEYAEHVTATRIELLGATIDQVISKQDVQAATSVIDVFYTMLDVHLKERIKEMQHVAKKAERKLQGLERDAEKQVDAKLLNFFRNTFKDNIFIQLYQRT